VFQIGFPSSKKFSSFSIYNTKFRVYFNLENSCPRGPPVSLSVTWHIVPIGQAGR
jgi:hypothetical protein